MEFIIEFIKYILHLNTHLADIVAEYSNWTYLILFIIVFCETGLVVTPFLPGDSLLLAAGIQAGSGSLDISILILVLYAAAFLGDNTNYFIGNWIGPAVFKKNYKLLKKDYLIRTEAFYEKHGGKTLIIARFVPIIRTFAPFVAGVGTMPYKRFITYSCLGNFLWIILFTMVGYLFGQLEFVQKNFSLIILSVIFLSILPLIFGFVKHKIKPSRISAEKKS